MQTLVDLQFNDLDLFLDEIREWDLDFRMIKSGGCVGHLIQKASSDILISFARCEQNLHQTGSTPPGFRTFAIPGAGCQGFWWRNRQVNSHCLLVFPSSNELLCVSREDFEVFTISLSLDYIERNSEQLEIAPGLDTEVIPLGHRRANRLRVLAHSVMKSRNTFLDDYGLQSLAQELLCICTSDTKTEAIRKRQRDHAISRIVQYLTINPAPITAIQGLCRIANVSERTLQYAFKERYGIPPNVFVKRWKLNSARRLLRQMEPATGTVTEACRRYGFEYPSQFTQDYKALFAELPSHTLARKG